jgi:hypothetical protein
MRRLNNKGIALITALMFTLITLAIVLGVFSLVSQGIKSSASSKTYKNVTEAAYGGANVTMFDILPTLFPLAMGGTVPTGLFANLTNSIGFAYNNPSCLTDKMTKSTAAWASTCDAGLNPKANPDFTFKLGGVSNQSFKVYTKIVDTIPGVAYPTSTSGATLLGGGVTESSAGTTTNLSHYVYRIEVAGERDVANPSEKSKVSVLYEY